LKTTYAKLKSLLASAQPGPGSAAPDGIDPDQWGQLSGERGRIDTLEQVLSNAKQQVSLLQQILALLQATHDAVDQAIATLQQLAKDADDEAQQSSQLFEQLLKVALSGDPEAAAEQWLDDQLAQKTQQALKQLGWGTEPFIQYLLGSRDDVD